MLEFLSSPLLTFLAGFLTGCLAFGLWHLLQFWNDLRITRKKSAEFAAEEEESGIPMSHEAWERVRACRKRLRFNPNPNPEWIAPLLKEIPPLVREIAEIYYPDHPDPLQAPKVSEFARAVQFASMDIAEALQSKRIGRLVDVSAGSSVRAFQTGQRVWKHPKLQTAKRFFGKLDPIYKVGQPLWQVIRFKSPVTWIALATSNAAVRTLQPAIVNIIARRAIDLYSGNLANPDMLPQPATPVAKPEAGSSPESESESALESAESAAEQPETAVTSEKPGRLRLRRIRERLQFRKKKSNP